MAEEPKPGELNSDIQNVDHEANLLFGRYYIDPNTPLPSFDSPSARAFSVEDRRDIGRQLFALICTPELPPRLEAMKALKGEQIPGLLPLVDWGVVFWPPSNARIMVVVFEHPLGGRVIDAKPEYTMHMNEYDIPRNIFEPLAHAISELSERNITHRAIRPENLYFMDPECTQIVLGECITGPAAFDQPIMFEPLHSISTNPGGRGQGKTSDDLYALGICIFIILTGGNPLENTSDINILYQKFENGSYASICGDTDFHASLTEPFRGLLCDNPSEQWGLEQLDVWINGRRQPQIQNVAPIKAREPFLFNGYEHRNPQALAHAFSKNFRDAIRSIKQEDFQRWLRHAVLEPNMADAVKNLLEIAAYNRGTLQGRDDYLVFKTILILDPTGPMRFKNFSCVPEGYGPAIAVDFLRKGHAKDGIDIVIMELYSHWFKSQPASHSIPPDLKIMFSQSRKFLKNKDPGYGIDRCLYKLNSGLPCQSPLIAAECVITIEDLLPALDKVAASVDKTLIPIDRHIAAFVATRFKEDIQPHLRAFASPKQETSIIGMISLLAFMQYKMHPEPLLGLAGWVGGLLGPAIDMYFSKTTRRKLESQIPKLVRKGHLPDLFELIDNAELRQQDWDSYNEARDTYSIANNEMINIQKKAQEQMLQAETTGERVTAVISVLSTMTIITLIFIGHYF